MKKLLLSAVLIVSLAACKSKESTEDETTVETDTTVVVEKPKSVTVALNEKSDSGVSGEATFTETDGQVTFTANIQGLKPGIHAIHIHEKADCSAADGSSAGGHWNPTAKKHGKWGSEEFHKGDIGNFPADENGNGTITLTTSEWCIGCGDPNKEILGKGLIVHEKADDYVTQPTGDAGGRVACAGIIEE